MLIVELYLLMFFVGSYILDVVLFCSIKCIKVFLHLQRSYVLLWSAIRVRGCCSAGWIGRVVSGCCRRVVAVGGIGILIGQCGGWCLWAAPWWAVGSLSPVVGLSRKVQHAGGLRCEVWWPPIPFWPYLHLELARRISSWLRPPIFATVVIW